MTLLGASVIVSTTPNTPSTISNMPSAGSSINVA